MLVAVVRRMLARKKKTFDLAKGVKAIARERVGGCPPPKPSSPSLPARSPNTSPASRREPVGATPRPRCGQVPTCAAVCYRRQRAGPRGHPNRPQLTKLPHKVDLPLSVPAQLFMKFRGAEGLCPLPEVVFHLVEQPLFRGRVIHRRCRATARAVSAVRASAAWHLHVDVNERSPRPLPFGPARLCRAADCAPVCVPSGILSLCGCSSVGTSISAPTRPARCRSDGAVQVVFAALEEGVRLHLQEHVEIARRPAIDARLAFIRKRRRVPSSTPAGMLTLSFRCTWR